MNDKVAPVESTRWPDVWVSGGTAPYIPNHIRYRWVISFTLRLL